MLGRAIHSHMPISTQEQPALKASEYPTFGNRGVGPLQMTPTGHLMSARAELLDRATGKAKALGATERILSLQPPGDPNVTAQHRMVRN